MRLRNIHPGEVLQEEFLKQMNLTTSELAFAIRIPPSRLDEIVRNSQELSIDDALILSNYFGNSVEFWLGLQRSYNQDLP